MKKKVVIIGGGNGTAISTQAMKKYINEIEISSVVSVCDSGRSAGRLREKYKTLPPGDILRAVISMSKYDYSILKRIFRLNRFHDVDNLNEYNLGYLFLVWAKEYSGNILNSIRALEQSIEAVGKVYPCCLTSPELMAKLTNGDIVEGEKNIDRPNYSRENKIQEVWLEPSCDLYQESEKEIINADYIIIGPGSLYSSLIAALLPNKMDQAIKQSKAKIIYVCGNAYESEGETGPEILSENINVVQRYLPRKIDVVVYNNCELNKTQEEMYKRKNWSLLNFDKNNLGNFYIIQGNYEKEQGGLDPEELGKLLMSYICK